MTQRPTFIDLNSRANSVASTFRLGLPSPPRIQHFDGDIPPSLSPLDAFAAQSRRLAKELEETRKAGQRRMSRLPPHVVTESLIQHQANRPQCFRSLSDNLESSPVPQEHDGPGNCAQLAHPETRPMSAYPQIGGVPIFDLDCDQEFRMRSKDSGGSVHQTARPSDYFEMPRSESPEPVDPKINSLPVAERKKDEQATKGGEHAIAAQDLTASQVELTSTLAPPNADFARKTNQARQYHESSDDEYPSSNTGSTFSKPRQLSSSSGVSLPRSPASPFIPPHARSPSTNSEASAFGYQKPRSHLNFSRPISLNNLKADSPSRQQSKSPMLNQAYSRSFDSPRTPAAFDDNRSEISDGFVSGEVSTHIHDKYSLPRGRMGPNESAVFRGLSRPNFEWEEHLAPNLATPSPPSSARPSRELDGGLIGTEDAGFAFDFTKKSSTHNRLAQAIATESATGSTTSPVSHSTTAPDAPNAAAMPPTPSHTKESQSVSSRSNSTVRPQSSLGYRHQGMSAEEHVEKGIELHQHGDLEKSTYHLRIAAKQDNPTGMLLYALACRHGWGMRANQAEGVQWLRKAVDSAMLEVAEDESPSNNSATKDFHEKKAHRAQFALSVYELGVSHLKGWGIEQDKALALRCFEIAGNWGDVDALTEAGFCYAKGIGCKKDLRKAAKFYRMAEAQGASMVGNSWIYKDKYNDTDSATTGRSSRSSQNSPTPDKSRNKSRTRNIFTRKKSVQP